MPVNRGFSVEDGEERKDIDDPDTDLKEADNNAMLYTIEDNPPWYISGLLGLQHYLTMFGSTVSIPFLIAPAMCISADDPVRGYIISTIFFVSGIVTLIQSTFGVRLPIVQGGTFSFLVPTFAILSLDKWACPSNYVDEAWVGNTTEEYRTEIWQTRMREIQGAICVSAIFQMFLGYFGLIGLLLRYITPLTITPAVAMIGVSLFQAASHNCEGNWGISLLTMFVMILFSQYLREVDVPGFKFSKGKFVSAKLPILKLFPILLTILLMWGLCAILTVSNAIGPDSAARTDTKLALVYNSVWFRFPYPFQWGIPTVSAASVFGMLAGVLASAVESVGDYYACARLSGAPRPPTHAINRGIGMEGLGCILAGIWGTGNGTTSYSENIGAIGVTKVGSRRVIQYAGLIMLVFGLFSKFGAFFLTIPTPIVGGIFTIMFGMITAVGLSNLQFVDLNSSRNLFVLGFSMFFALMLPEWVKSWDKSHVEPLTFTGNPEFDQIIKVLLSTHMFIGGFLGFFLDNTIPGTREERGLIAWEETHHADGEDGAQSAAERCYGLPFGMGWLSGQKWAQYIPCLPTFQERLISCRTPCRKK